MNWSEFSRRRLLQASGAAMLGMATPAMAESGVERAAGARDRYWASIGASDPDLITYFVNPQFQGAPAWPATRQAYRVVRSAESLIIASDGLSDPFDDGPAGGFGLEVFIETPDLVGASFEALRDSWAFPLIEIFAQNVANLGGISDHLQRHGIISMELPAPSAVARAWRTDRDTVGVLINLAVPGRELRVSEPALGTVQIVPLTMITPAETQFIIAGGADGRRELAERLAVAGIHHRSVIGRESLV